MDLLKSFSASGGLGTTGTVLSAGSQVMGGISARRAGDATAAQADVAAGQVQASSQRVAAEQERKTKLVSSRAQAVAAASGAGATDPTVLDTIGRIASEGAYRSELALYEGNTQAAALRARGEAARYEGRAAQTAGFIKGAGTLFSKYGMKAGGANKSVITSTNVGGVDPYLDESGWGMT